MSDIIASRIDFAIHIATYELYLPKAMPGFAAICSTDSLTTRSRRVTKRLMLVSILLKVSSCAGDRATSISLVISTFWNDDKSYAAVSKYLKAQEGKSRRVIRLFVFRTPQDANSFRNIIQANWNSYANGTLGAVLLCSVETYERLLMRMSQGNTNFVRDLQGRDFGLLGYGTRNQGDYLFAVLDLYVDQAGASHSCIPYRSRSSESWREHSCFNCA